MMPEAQLLKVALEVACLERFITPMAAGMRTAARMPMMAMTVRSSMRVKPCREGRRMAKGGIWEAGIASLV